MTHEEFDQICTEHLQSQIKPESEDGLILAYRHEERLQLIIEHMPVHGLMELVSYLISTIGNPFLAMAAVTDGLERIDGVGVERITWQKLEGWWEQSQCLHSFRPASLNGKPARHCFLCDKTDTLTPEEYFSAFGERGWKF